jgi:hypothetical protein
MYARRVAEAVELAKARARSIMTAGADAGAVDLSTAGAKPKARSGGAAGAVERKPSEG